MAIAPTVTREPTVLDATRIIDTDLAGRIVVQVDATPCAQRTGDHDICGLVCGHRGECWRCSPELVEQSGPWALLPPTVR